MASRGGEVTYDVTRRHRNYLTTIKIHAVDDVDYRKFYSWNGLQNEHVVFGDDSTIKSSDSCLRVGFQNLKLPRQFSSTKIVEIANLLSTFYFQKRLVQALSRILST